MRWLNGIHIWIANHCNSNKSIYQFLTPNDKAEHIAEYSKALKDALENSRVKNIAISGSYGSGKTSFIKTFEKNNAQYSFLDISLATFKDGSGKKEDLSSIEKSIIEQMFYKVKNATVPQSRLKKINRLKWTPIKIISILLIVLSYFVLFQSQALKNIPSLEWLPEISSNNFLKYLPVVVLAMGAYYVVSKLLIVISNTNIDKLSLQNIELKSDGASLLNQYLDEILYFFEKTDFDAVVFQDLDRFENLDIFTKLRELNNFVNNSEQVSRRVVFLYAIKDEMFQNANERTKFFDFLIPIIPYINATSSKEKLLEYFESKAINRDFLYDVSLYISDMRLLKNIYNEYLIYSSNLDKRLDKTKLLAMIIYKNFEPKDFEKLHKCKGLVYDIFHSEKKEYLELHHAKIENKIINIKKSAQEIEEESREDIRELRRLYILKIIENSNHPFNKTIYTSDKIFTIQSSIEDDNFQSIIESNGLGTYNQQSQYLNIKFVDIEKELDSYKKRAGLVLDKTNGKKNTLLKEIEDLKKAQDGLKEISLKELFEEFNDVTIFENITQKDKDGTKKFDNHRLMKYLLSYGYIDENYEEYISNFFGVSITKDEQEFLRNVKNSGEALSFDYELKNLEDIAKFRLSENEFNKQSVLNLHLTNYLLENQNVYQKKIEKLFQQLSNESGISKEFIMYCLDNSVKNIEFAKLIAKYCKKLWLYIFQESQLILEKQKEYFSILLEALDKAALISLNIDNSIKAFIENYSYLPSYGQRNDKFESLIQELQVKYKSLDTEDAKKVPLTVDYIFQNELYELNQEMIEHYINRFGIDTGRLLISNFTTIREYSKDTTKELFEYVQNEINQYAQNVLLELPDNTQESEESLIKLLSLDGLDESLKLKIIEKEEAKISDINSVDKALWEHLLQYNKVVASWDNAFKYFNDDDSDNDLLLDYLNIEENAEKISEIRCGAEYAKDNEFFNGKLLRLIIETNAFNVTSYEYLVKNLGYWYEDLDISKLDEDKVVLLIKYNRFQFKKACFDALKEKNSNLHIALIEKNKDKLLEEFDNFQFNTEDIEKILAIDESILSDAIKKDLVEKIDTELIVNKNIARLIYKYVDRSNIKPLEYTKKMLQNLDSLESRINLIVEQNSGLDENDLVEMLELLPSEYSKIAKQEGKQAALQNNYYNKKLISVLQERDLITSHKEEKDNKIRLFIKNKG